MEIKNWAIGVNRIILNDTSTSIGENSVQTDTSDNGSDMTILKASGSPDTYSVTMMFSNDIEDSFYKKFGKTEWQTFLDWFKYNLLMGQNPFYFHKIDDPRGEVSNRSSVYKIKSNGLPKGSPEGSYYKVTMTWIEYLKNPISFSEEEITVDTIYITDGVIDLRFTDKPETIPEKTDFSAIMENLTTGANEETVSLQWLDYDGFKSALLYFDSPTVTGDYLLTLTYKEKSVQGKFTIS